MHEHASSHKPSFDSLPDWLSPEEARTFLGIGRTTLYELIRSRQLPSRKFGRLIRVPKNALAPRVEELVSA